MINNLLIFNEITNNNRAKTLIKIYSLELQVKFSFPLTVLHILDQISPGAFPAFYVEQDYSQAWMKKFGKEIYTVEMEGILSKYQKIRKKYLKFPECINGKISAENGLFPSDPSEIADPFLDAFAESNTIDEALQKLRDLLTEDEMLTFKQILSYFEEKMATFAIDAKVVDEFIKGVNAILDTSGAAQHIENIRDFYGSEYRSLKSINIIWSPGGCGGICWGDHIFIRVPFEMISPTDLAHTQHMISSIIVHEITHHISSNMPSDKKKQLTQSFLKTSDLLRYPHFIYAFEEPLVESTQMLYLKRMNLSKPSWFNDPVAKIFLSILEEHLLQAKALNVEFVEKCSKAANQNHSKRCVIL